MPQHVSVGTGQPKAAPVPEGLRPLVSSRSREIAGRQTVEVRVRGTVQGVGFRPTVWRLARDAGLVGEVLNDGRGVLIRATGPSDSISRFVRRMQCETPPLARIEAVETEPLAGVIEFAEFQIAASTAGENRTRVTPDASICAACSAEVLNPAERRYLYPFANCTHCGPRFSIVKEVPYDRARTTMCDFPMCEACRVEYEQPADRRFHAQPIACADCGPSVWLEDLRGESRQGNGPRPNEAVEEVVKQLEEGKIVAVRGLGGFHLACDARNAQAVRSLRQRKHRYGKPFALMARDVESIRRYCRVTPLEEELLASPEAPIVLLEAHSGGLLADDLAPGLKTLGFMLPYTPLHLLILGRIDRPLVMTSGNASDEPQVTSIDRARSELKGIADLALMHDREIANRIDDSVVRVMAGRARLLRRARGYAPRALSLPSGFEEAPDLLAFGSELKATFCLVKEGAAIVSQHQGDLEDLSTFDDYQKNLGLYAQIYDHRPRVTAADMHPEYLSTKLAKERAASASLPLLEVQHHHAHIASCMAENGVGLDTPPVLGIALDGLGYGEDGTIWGGEFLVADYRRCRRAATFKPIAMLGGAQAIREPWRNAYAHLKAAGWERLSRRYGLLDIFHYLEQKPLRTLDRMMERGINAPAASSCGRLFDAVAALLGVCREKALFEGQGATQLEALAWQWIHLQPTDRRCYPFGTAAETAGGMACLDPSPMWEALCEDFVRGRSLSCLAARFHRGLAVAVAEMAQRILADPGQGASIDTVALSGGCFQNRLLLEEVVRLLEAAELRCLLQARVPANDGGVSLGQAAIAAARWIQDERGPKKQTNA